MNDSLIKIRNLSFSHGNTVIFDGINMDIRRQGITAILGPSGSGKTTLLKLICGQLQPTSGSIEIDGENVHQLRTKALYVLRKKMGVLFQSNALLTDISVFDNVAYPLREHTQLTQSTIRTLVLLKLNAVGLRGAAQLMPTALSGGMARRVALARAMALDPMLIMYDEPFAGQDPISMGVLVQLIDTLSRALNMCSVVISHDVPETLSIADYVYVISNGGIVEQGEPDDLRRSDSPWAKQFLNGRADGPLPFHYSAPPLLDDLFSSVD